MSPSWYFKDALYSISTAWLFYVQSYLHFHCFLYLFFAWLFAVLIRFRIPDWNSILCHHRDIILKASFSVLNGLALRHFHFHPPTQYHIAVAEATMQDPFVHPGDLDLTYQHSYMQATGAMDGITTSWSIGCPQSTVSIARNMSTVSSLSEIRNFNFYSFIYI